jgi:hypothetical protein
MFSFRGSISARPSCFYPPPRKLIGLAMRDHAQSIRVLADIIGQASQDARPMEEWKNVGDWQAPSRF